MNFLKDLQHLDVWLRAAKTFVQAFLAAWAVTGNAVNKDVLLAALAAGLSAVWNYSKQVV